MAQYIDKSALVAEIERLEKINQEYKKTWKWKFKWFYRTIIGRLEVLEGLKNYIDTLEVKDLELTWEDMRELYIIFAEVDTEIEFCKTNIQAETLGYYKEVLKRFKAQKGE